MSFTTPLRKDVTQSVAMESIVAILQTALNLNDSQCFEVEAEDVEPDIPVGGKFWLTVAGDEGRFPQEEQAAGNITESGGFIVTIWTRIQLDRTGHAKILLHDTQRGILEIKRQVLAALVGQDPVTDQGFTFVRQQIFAIRATKPSTWKDKGGLGIAKMQIAFGLEFDWGLTADTEVE